MPRRGLTESDVLVRYFCVVHHWDGERERCPACLREESPGSRVAVLPTERTVRAGQLMRAVVANVEGDVSDIEELFTADVSGEGPATAAGSREELAVELEERRSAFVQHDVSFRHVDVNGDMARVEWVATGLHVGQFVLERNGVIMEPTGLRLRVHAVTVAKFRGDRICSWRSTWDDLTMMDADELAAAPS
jgi:SnoaL-like polyketide cyclase